LAQEHGTVNDLPFGLQRRDGTLACHNAALEIGPFALQGTQAGPHVLHVRIAFR
jgi:hypothetical protein